MSVPRYLKPMLRLTRRRSLKYWSLLLTLLALLSMIWPADAPAGHARLAVTVSDAPSSQPTTQATTRPAQIIHETKTVAVVAATQPLAAALPANQAWTQSESSKQLKLASYHQLVGDHGSPRLFTTPPVVANMEPIDSSTSGTLYFAPTDDEPTITLPTANGPISGGFTANSTPRSHVPNTPPNTGTPVPEPPGIGLVAVSLLLLRRRPFEPKLD